MSTDNQTEREKEVEDGAEETEEETEEAREETEKTREETEEVKKDTEQAEKETEDEARDVGEESESRIEDLEESLEEKEERINDLESRLKRVQADFQNYKKRSERKKEEFAKYATVDIVTRLLDIRDNLNKALNSDGDIDNLKQGVEMVQDELDKLLLDEGVEKIETDGKPDPEKHEVMMKVDSEEHGEGEIVDVYQPGYRMKDKVIREARVTVADSSNNTDGEEE
ncbi:MAG: nucleotide exchange factor GrpE [Halobacteria archaeon]